LKTRPEIGFWTSKIYFAAFHGNSKPKPTPFPGKWFSAGLDFRTGILTSKTKLLKIKFGITKCIQGKFCNLRTEFNLTRKPIPMTESRNQKTIKTDSLPKQVLNSNFTTGLGWNLKQDLILLK
jgi:hypothetical protein